MTHQHAYSTRQQITAPVGRPPGHTTFHLLLCDCGEFDCFPVSNYELIDAEWRGQFEAALVGIGFRRVRLDAEPTP